MRHFDEVMGDVATFLPVELMEELNAVISQESDDSYDSGVEYGLSQGSDTGYSEGYEDGYDAGQADATN